MTFIEEIATYVIKHAPQYGIKVYSTIIAQAILESALGTSELAKNAHNYFGLKFRTGRCPGSIGTYAKVGSEQLSNGKYTSSIMLWFKFYDMESGVKGYFDFINISNYKNLKGITDPQKYLEMIKADGYCTSQNYVQNVMNIIKKYNLTKYDPQPESQKYYRVQVGAFKSEANAKRLQAQIKSAGFSVIIKKVGDLYKCQLGAFKNKANAEDLLQSVKSKGFNAFLIYQ